MGRSVSYPTGSVVAFRLLDDGEEDDADCLRVPRRRDHPYHENELSVLRALRRMARSGGPYPPAQCLRRLRHIDLLRPCRDLARRTRRFPVLGSRLHHATNGNGTALARPGVGKVHRPVWRAAPGGSVLEWRSSLRTLPMHPRHRVLNLPRSCPPREALGPVGARRNLRPVGPCCPRQPRAAGFPLRGASRPLSRP